MEGLYHQTNKMVHEVQSGLGRLERAKGKEFYTEENQEAFICGRLFDTASSDNQSRSRFYIKHSFL